MAFSILLLLSFKSSAASECEICRMPWTAHKETINDLYIATYNTPDGGRLRKLTVGINPDVIEGDIRSESRLDRPWQDSEYGLAE